MLYGWASNSNMTHYSWFWGKFPTSHFQVQHLLHAVLSKPFIWIRSLSLLRDLNRVWVLKFTKCFAGPPESHGNFPVLYWSHMLNLLISELKQPCVSGVSLTGSLCVTAFPHCRFLSANNAMGTLCRRVWPPFLWCPHPVNGRRGSLSLGGDVPTQGPSFPQPCKSLPVTWVTARSRPPPGSWVSLWASLLKS